METTLVIDSINRRQRAVISHINNKVSKHTTIKSTAELGVVVNNFAAITAVCVRRPDVHNLTVIVIPRAHVVLSRIGPQER